MRIRRLWPRGLWPRRDTASQLVVQVVVVVVVVVQVRKSCEIESDLLKKVRVYGSWTRPPRHQGV